MGMRLLTTLQGSPDIMTVRVYRDSDWGEYVCRLYVQGTHDPECDYHTDDVRDAMQTARAMLEH